VLDFSSALYLGLRHPSRSLRPWDRLTTGMPAALGEPPAAGRVAAALAGLQGCEAAVLARSTLHALLDCFAVLGGPARPVLVDGGVYPIARWGALAAGARPTAFAHHDPADLRRTLRRLPGSGPGPLVVADGLCPGCGGVAPLADYLELSRGHGGLLLVDDTQALGVLGRRQATAATASPYGAGGGGSLPWAAVAGPQVVAVASLAKGFGVPLAVVAGGRMLIALLAALTPSRQHTSPPSAADLHAAEHALAANRRLGERLRRRLAGLVARLRRRLAELGITASGGLFPVQHLPAMPSAAAARLAGALADRGVLAVPQRHRCRPGATVTLLVTARHTPGDIDRAAAVVAAALAAVHGREGGHHAAG
jgi:8-amino-7-oxononanoate synthase